MVGFHAAVVALLAPTRSCPAIAAKPKHAQTSAWLWTMRIRPRRRGLRVWIAIEQGRQPALECVAGYTIETSLSIDNLFVFLVLFQGFRISQRRQHTALLWGVAAPSSSAASSSPRASR